VVRLSLREVLFLAPDRSREASCLTHLERALRAGAATAPGAVGERGSGSAAMVISSGRVSDEHAAEERASASADAKNAMDLIRCSTGEA
jgi:hypothetical protein